MVDVVGKDGTVHTTEVMVRVVAQPDGRVIGARDTAAVTVINAAWVVAIAKAVLTLDEVLSFLRSLDHVGGTAGDVALYSMSACRQTEMSTENLRPRLGLACQRVWRWRPRRR